MVDSFVPNDVYLVGGSGSGSEENATASPEVDFGTPGTSRESTERANVLILTGANACGKVFCRFVRHWIMFDATTRVST